MPNGPESTPSPSELFRLTYRPQTEEFEVVPEAVITPDMNYPGDPAGAVDAVTVPREATIYCSTEPNNDTRLYEEFSQLYLGVGPGTHYVRDIVAKTGVSQGQIYGIVQRTVEVLPSQVITVKRREHVQERGRITFGNLALSTSLSSVPEHESRRRNAQLQAKIDGPLEDLETKSEQILYEQKQRTLARDAEKQALMDYDHALLKFDGQDTRRIDFRSPNELLLMRLIQATKKVPVRPSTVDPSYLGMSAPVVRAYVWGQMPLRERRLFTDDPDSYMVKNRRHFKSIFGTFAEL